MTNIIKCPHCGKMVEVTEALKHQIEEELLVNLELRYKKEIEQAVKTAEEKALLKAQNQIQLELKDKQNESEELKQHNKKLSDQLLETNKLIRQMKMQDEEKKVEMERTLQKEIGKIRQETLKRSDDEHRLKDLEKDKKISDMEKLVEELKRKAQQGSMQTQGEVLELDLENMLQVAFPTDEIVPVEKGVRGADIRQIVKTVRGNVCGVILWESKRTKVWSDEWTVKLKNDLRAEKAHVPVIVSAVLPKEAESGMGLKDGVYVCSYQLILPVADILRGKLIEIAREKFITANKGQKAEQIYEYITSHEFRQSVEAIAEVYQDIQKQIFRERMAFEKIWKMREAQVLKLFSNTAGIIGNIRGRVGVSLPDVKGLELLEGEEDNDLQSGDK